MTTKDTDARDANENGKYWVCIIGPVSQDKLPKGADSPPRSAARSAVLEMTGENPQCWSGWGCSQERFEAIQRVWNSTDTAKGEQPPSETNTVICPQCRSNENNPYTDANGISMRACHRCFIQWRAEPQQEPEVEQVCECGHSEADHNDDKENTECLMPHCYCTSFNDDYPSAPKAVGPNWGGYPLRELLPKAVSRDAAECREKIYQLLREYQDSDEPTAGVRVGILSITLSTLYDALVAEFASQAGAEVAVEQERIAKELRKIADEARNDAQEWNRNVREYIDQLLTGEADERD